MTQVWRNKLYYREQQMSQESLETKPMPTFWIRCKNYNDNNTLEELAKENRESKNSRISPEEFLGEMGCATAYFFMLFDVRKQDNVINFEAIKDKRMKIGVYCCEKIAIKDTDPKPK